MRYYCNAGYDLAVPPEGSSPFVTRSICKWHQVQKPSKECDIFVPRSDIRSCFTEKQSQKERGHGTMLPSSKYVSDSIHLFY